MNFISDGLALTKEWLQRHLAIAEEHTDIKRKVSAVINDAYLEFLEWDKEVKFPEVGFYFKYFFFLNFLTD